MRLLSIKFRTVLKISRLKTIDFEVGAVLKMEPFGKKLNVKCI